MTSARKTNVFFLGLVVFYIMMCIYVIPFIPERMQNANGTIVLSQLFVLIPGFVYALLSKGRALSRIGCGRLGIGNSFLLLLFTLSMVPVISLINAFSMMFAKNYLVEQLDNMNRNPLWLNLLLMAVVPAFVEEITFRGIMYTGYRASVIRRAVFASAIAFGMFHMNVNQFCYAALMGIVFSLLYEATGSIFSTMLVHFIFNANSVILDRVLTWFEAYVGKMAEKNESFEEMASQLSQTETVTTLADYSLHQKLTTLVTLLPFAAVGGTIACFLMIAIARRLHRGEHLRQTAASLLGLRVKTDRYRQGEYVELPSEEYGGRIVDGFYVIAVILCIAMMLL